MLCMLTMPCCNFISCLLNGWTWTSKNERFSSQLLIWKRKTIKRNNGNYKQAQEEKAGEVVASIQTAIQLNDNFTNVANNILSATNMMISTIEDMGKTMSSDVDTAAIQGIRDYLNDATLSARDLNSQIEKLDTSSVNAGLQQTERHTRAVGQAARTAGSGFKGWQKAIIVANQAVGLVQSTLGRLGVFDLSGAFDRMDTMSRFQKTVSIMTGDTGAANAALAQLKDTTQGTAYGLDVASKAVQGFLTRGMSLGNATDQVRIWSDAVSFYGEGTNEQLSSVVDAIGKMYSKGTVEADQLDRLFDAGIGAAELYANAVGRSVSDVKADLSKGTISAEQFIDTVSQAMDTGMSHGAAKDAGATWATTFSNIGAAITRGWVEIIENLDAALAAKGLPSTMEMVTQFGASVEGILGTIGSNMGMVVDLISAGYDVLGTAGSFLVENWSVISPLVIGVAAAVGLYTAALFTYNAIQAASAAITGIKAAAEMRAAGATFVATVQQHGFNAALLACPITWVVLGLLAIVTVTIMVARYIAKTGNVATTAFGVITGGVNVVLQFFKNLGLSIANIALGIGFSIATLAGNIKTAFGNAIFSVQAWWYDLLSTATSVISGICAELNRLPFVEFDYSGISSAASDYAAKSAAAAASKGSYQDIGAAFRKGMNTFDTYQKGWVSDAYRSGTAWGDRASGKLTKAINGLKQPSVPKNSANDYASQQAASGSNAAQTAKNTGDTARNTAEAAKALSSSFADLKLIRELAERQAINKYTTATIKVDMTGMTNQITGTRDIDGIMNVFTKKLKTALITSAEGVHT